MKLALGFIAVVALFAFALHAGTSVVAAAPDGKNIFNTNCSTCHQANGMGSPGVFPPLAGNKDVTAADPSKIIGIVLHGDTQALTVNGKQYNGGMPPWKGTLSNADIAAVLTYVRSSWGNKAPAVTEAQVAKVK
ncbi:MAG: cytochrome c [Candidatus Eremiobacteraeota bacterium]|nr:cytochrome c [Candidatus Eremiobacteraeota bacterium]